MAGVIKCIFFSEFHHISGPIISHQVCLHVRDNYVLLCVLCVCVCGVCVLYMEYAYTPPFVVSGTGRPTALERRL